MRSRRGRSAPSVASSWNGANRTPSRPSVGQQYRRYAARNASALAVRDAGPRGQVADVDSAGLPPPSATDARPAAPPGRRRRPRRTGRRSSSPALALHGSSSASSSSQPVSSSSNSPARLGGGPQPLDQLRGQLGGEERAAGPGPDRTERVARCAEPGARRLEVPADQGDRPRAHVLLLAHHRGHTVGSVRLERLGRVLQQPGLRRGRHRAHGRRQVDQPARVDREPAHHLQRRRGVLGAHARSGPGRRSAAPGSR